MIQFSDKLSAELIKTNATDLGAAQAAWVSTAAEESQRMGTEKRRRRMGANKRVANLIEFLMRDQHGSPFEHGQFTFMVNAPIFVARQFMKHRTWSFNEVSGRYTELEPKFYLPNKDRPLVQIGKPGAYTYIPGDEIQYSQLDFMVRDSCILAWHHYEELLKAGIAKELARIILPVNTYTTFYATANPRALMKFLSLRAVQEETTIPTSPQAEIDAVAKQIEQHFKAAMPLTHKAFNDYGRIAP